jgi:protein mago nashi
MKEDDNNWPMPDRVGKQELEIKMNGEHICFNTTKLGSVLQVQQSKDPDGLRIFYYLVQVRGRHNSCVVLQGSGAHFETPL